MNQSLQLCLKLSTSPDKETFKAVISLSEVDISVESIRPRLYDAVVDAAGQCARKLLEHGYETTPEGILRALETALHEDKVLIDPSLLN